MLSKLIAETELAGLENPIQEAPVTKEWVRQFELGLLTFSARKGKWTRILKFESPSNEYLPYDFVVWRTKDRKSTRLNSSHIQKSRMPSSA